MRQLANPGRMAPVAGAREKLSLGLSLLLALVFVPEASG